MLTRVATEQDSAPLARIDLATWTTATTPVPRPDHDSYQFFDEDTSPQDVLVAEVGGQVAGYVKLRPPTPLDAQRHILQVGGLAVDPQMQGSGIGERLLLAAVSEAARRGARKVTVRVLAHNEIAKRLYLRCGFIVEGTLEAEFLLDGRFVDDILMARGVGNGAA